ncbi:MAG: dTDP-4-dehydrorhamnose reductase, partial [Porticoccaceae bacterium]
MDSVLIIGVEGAVGAGLALTLQQSHSVVGLANRAGINVDGCRTVHATSHNAASVRQHVQSERPDWIIFCGAASRSSWDSDAVRSEAISDQHAIEWAKAAADGNIEFCMISSDAVFTGPWMLHKEDDEHFCATPQAERLRQIETAV